MIFLSVSISIPKLSSIDHPLFPKIILSKKRKKKFNLNILNNQISNTSFSIRIEFKKVKFFPRSSKISQTTYLHQSWKLFKFSFNWLKILKKTRIKFLVQNFSKSNQLIFFLVFYLFIVVRFSFQFMSPFTLQLINFHREISRKDSVGNDGRVANTVASSGKEVKKREWELARP